HLNSYDIDSVKEVLAKSPLAHCSLQLRVSRRDYTNIDVKRLAVSNRMDLALLKEPKKLWLKRERQITNLIQKQSPVLGSANYAFTVCDRARECALSESKKLTLYHVVGGGGAIKRQEDVHAARAPRVNCSRNQLLTGAGLAGNENGDIRRSNLVNLLEHLAHCTACANEARKLDLSEQTRRIKNQCSAVLVAKHLSLESLLDNVQDRLYVDRAVKIAQSGRVDYSKQILGLLIVAKRIDEPLGVLFVRERLKKRKFLGAFLITQPGRGRDF